MKLKNFSKIRLENDFYDKTDIYIFLKIYINFQKIDPLN